MQGDVVITGTGLHTGEAVTVRLRAHDGAVRLGTRGIDAGVHELAVVSTQRATTVEARAGALRVRTVEHLFAALAGMSIYEGLAIDVDGPEMPLLDGGASAFCVALSRLGLRPTSPRVRVARRAVIDFGDSEYEFTPPARAVRPELEARVILPGLGELPPARWVGDADDFIARIAPARTFALARDLPELAELGLSRHVDPASVVVLSPPEVYCSGRPFRDEEPALHKLLDLMGDSYLYGGPPLGRVRAVRPGHGANHHAFRRAREEGILVPLG